MALNFQVAVIPGAIDEEGRVGKEVEQIQQLGQQMQSYISRAGQPYSEPLRISAFPDSSSFRTILARNDNISLEDGTFIDSLKESTIAHWAFNGSAEPQTGCRYRLGSLQVTAFVLFHGSKARRSSRNDSRWYWLRQIRTTHDLDCQPGATLLA